MQITVKKEDWDLARQITSSTEFLFSTEYNILYPCSCAVAQAVKRKYPDGYLHFVGNMSLVYEEVRYTPTSEWDLDIFGKMVRDFDLNYPWPFSDSAKITLDLEPV